MLDTEVRVSWMWQVMFRGFFQFFAPILILVVSLSAGIPNFGRSYTVRGLVIVPSQGTDLMSQTTIKILVYNFEDEISNNGRPVLTAQPDEFGEFSLDKLSPLNNYLIVPQAAGVTFHPKELVVTAADLNAVGGNVGSLEGFLFEGRTSLVQ